MRLLIAGDLAPTNSNKMYFEEGDAEKLLGSDLLNIWLGADFRIFNLEVPLTNRNSPIKKFGPALSAASSTINGINALNPSLVTLANNHILDHGTQGLSDTTTILKSNNIDFFGVGKDVKEASSPSIQNINGKKVGFYACAENEFSIATECSAGVNPFDPLESLDHITELKSKSDYVIVLFHGGKEQYRLPSPNLQKVCKKIIEKGADIVICQHSHCIGSFEEHNGGTIVYGQGNFIFDYNSNEFWNTSVIVEVNIQEEIEINYLPIVKNGNSVRLASQVEATNILSEFEQRSKQIKDSNFIEEEYNKLAAEKSLNYITAFQGYNIIYRIINKISKYKFSEKLYTKITLLKIINFIECESHRELVIRSLNVLYNRKEKEEKRI